MAEADRAASSNVGCCLCVGALAVIPALVQDTRIGSKGAALDRVVAAVAVHSRHARKCQDLRVRDLCVLFLFGAQRRAVIAIVMVAVGVARTDAVE